MKTFCLLLICFALQLNADASKTPVPADAKALGKQLMDNLPGIFSLDNANKEKLGNYDVPAILNGNWIIRSRPISLADSFAQETQTIVTIFARVGDEYVRLCTTEENEKPGTILSHSSPAYKRMLGELRYSGRVTLSGRDYMTDYDVFRDRQGRVIGAYLVGIPIQQ